MQYSCSGKVHYHNKMGNKLYSIYCLELILCFEEDDDGNPFVIKKETITKKVLFVLLSKLSSDSYL